MKSKFSRTTRRGLSALLSVLMALSCLTFGLTSTSAAETQDTAVSASADSDGTVSASANDGTVAAQSDDDTVAASADDSGSVSAQFEGYEVGDNTYYLLGSYNDSNVVKLAEVTTFSANDGTYTATIPLNYFESNGNNGNYYFAISDSNASNAGYKNMFTQDNKKASVSTDGSKIFSNAGVQDYNAKNNDGNNSEFHYACISFNAVPEADVTLVVTSTTDGFNYKFSYSGTITVPTYDVTVSTTTGGKISADNSAYGTTDITLPDVASDSTDKVFYVKANDGYNFNGFTTDNGVNVTYSTSNGVVTAKVTATAAGTVTANFTAKSTTTGDNIYTASSTIDTHNTTQTIDTSSVSATFFDYYADAEVKYGWGFKDSSVVGGTVDSNGTTSLHSTRLPFGVLNGALSSYASSNSSTIAYPLYFGDFYDYSEYSTDTSSLGLTSFWKSVNNSNALVATNKNDTTSKEKYYYSVTGLAGSSLSSDYNTIYHANSDGSNGAAMKEFDAEWLTSAEKNGISSNNYSSTGANSTGALASVVNSSFPVRIETKSSGSVDTSKIYFDLTSSQVSNWLGSNSDGHIVAYFYDNGTTDYVWKDMTLVSGTTTTYSVDNPDSKYDKVRFFGTKSNYTASSFSNFDSSYTSNYSTYFNSSIDSVDVPSTTSTTREFELSSQHSGSWVEASVYNGATYNYYTFDSNKGQDNAWFTYDSTSGAITMNYSDDAENYGVKGANYKNENAGYDYGFFPFDQTRESGNAQNFGFGVKLQMKFTLGSDGQITVDNGDGTTSKIDQVFEYSGDDDLWVYVDGQLVLDLGGDHKMSEGEINFADLTVTRNWAETPSCSDDSGTESFATANSALANFDNNNTSTVHTLTIYYMERGMNESNLKFGFNFVPVSNNLEVSNTVDTSSVNESLKSKVDAAVSGTVEYDYSMTSTSDTDGFSDKIGSQSTDAKTENKISLTNGTTENFVDQFTERQDNSMSITQTLPDSAQAYKFYTTYTVTDAAEDILKSSNGSYTGTVNGTKAYTTKTDDFTFYSSLGDDKTDTDATNYAVEYTNVLQTADLTIGKEVTNTTDTGTFTFTVYIQLPGESGYTERDFTYYTTDENDTSVASNGEVSITAGNTITIPGLPVNTVVEIVEVSSDAYALESITHTNWRSNDFTTDLDSNSATVTLGADDSVTVTNHPLTYRVDFVVPTRLYGNKVYTYSDNVTSDMFETKDGDTQPYLIANSDGTYTFTATYFTANCPYEEIFTKDITWDFEDKTASTNVTKTVTTGDTGSRVETATSYDLYAQVEPTTKESRLVDYTIVVDDETTISGKNLDYGSLIYKDNTESNGLIDNTDNNNFLYWNIYKMDDSGSKADANGDNTVDEDDIVAVCHSQKFTYCLYEDYYIEAIYKTDSTSTDTNVSTAESYINATASYLDVTRSLWNDTLGGTDAASTENYNLANKEYDRLYVDFVLAFDYNNVLLNAEGNDSEIVVGYEIVAKSGNNWYTTGKSITIDKSKLDQKNRIEFYYGFKNSSTNRRYTYGIRPYIYDGTTTTYGEVMAFSLSEDGTGDLQTQHSSN